MCRTQRNINLRIFQHKLRHTRQLKCAPLCGYIKGFQSCTTLQSTLNQLEQVIILISRPTYFVSNISVGEFFSDNRTIMFGLKAKKDNDPKKDDNLRKFQKCECTC